METAKLSPRSLWTLVPLAALAVLILLVVEAGKREVRSPWYDDMFEAAELSARAAEHLKAIRLERGIFVDPVNDPTESALIGQEYTQITTDRGYLDAKLASLDPNFAAVVVAMLRELGVGSGDCAAVGLTGSFPALNLSVLAALQTLGTRGVVAASIGASNYGANDPYFTWLDMQGALVASGHFQAMPTLASIGGGNDTGRGLSPRGRALAREAAQRAEVALLESPRLEGSVSQRLAHFRAGCEGEPAVYINVGGGVASLGHSANGALIPIGATLRVPPRNFPFRGVLLRLNEAGVPVVHLARLEELSARYGLAALPDAPPRPGEGDVFGEVRYGSAAPLTSLALLLGLLVGLRVLDQRAHKLSTPDPQKGA